MGDRPGAVVEVACFTPVDGRLALLARLPSRGGGRPLLPWAPVGREPLATVAAMVVRNGTGRSPAWTAQAGVLTEGAAHPSGASLSIVHVVTLPPGTPALDGHAWLPAGAPSPFAARQVAAVEAALTALRDRMDVDPVAFRLLPAAFTLTDLQGIYELLLGRRLHKASFRRALQRAALVEPTGDWRSEGRGRPAQLFRYAPRRRRGVRRPVRFELLA